jgi:hypothetical protein
MSSPKKPDSAPTLRPPAIPAEVGMIISTDFTVTGFGRRWPHCHQLANYLARYTSASENDPERSSTLLSTFFNELLEAIYRNHAKQGRISLRFERRHETMVVRAEVPVDDASLSFYTRTVEIVNQPDPMAWYRDRLEHDAPEDDANVLGLIELAVVYGSKLSILDVKKGTSLHLAIEIPLSELDEV